MAAPTHLIDSSGGVGVAVHDLGGPDADGTPVLLLVHANGFNAGSFRPFAAALTPAHRVVALDLRGHGSARTPEGIDWAWAGFGDDVTAVLDADVLPPGPVHGVGHSLGGAALLMAAARRPGALQSLWLFEPIAPPAAVVLSADPDRPNPLAEAAERRRGTFDSVDAAYDNYAGKPPLSAFHPDALRGYVEGGFEPDPDGDGVRLRCRPAWEAAIFRMTGGSPAWTALPDVDIPVTVAMGEAQPMGPAAFAPLIVDRLPDGRLVQHPELSHFGPLQDPATMASEVAAWIAGG